MVAIHPYPSTKMEERYMPAYPGAKFDKSGYCLVHPMVRLCKPNHDIVVVGSPHRPDPRRSGSRNRSPSTHTSSNSLARESPRTKLSKDKNEIPTKRNNSDRGYTIITRCCPLCNNFGDSMFPTADGKASSNLNKKQKARERTCVKEKSYTLVPATVSNEMKPTISGNRDNQINTKESISTRWQSRRSKRASDSGILLKHNPPATQPIRRQVREMSEELEIVVSTMQHKMSIESIHPFRKRQNDAFQRGSDKSVVEKNEDSSKHSKNAKNYNNDKVTMKAKNVSTAHHNGKEENLSHNEHRLRRNRHTLPASSHLHGSKIVAKSEPESSLSCKFADSRSNDSKNLRRRNSSDVETHENRMSNPQSFRTRYGLDDSGPIERSYSQSKSHYRCNSTPPPQNRMHVCQGTRSQNWRRGHSDSESVRHMIGRTKETISPTSKGGASKSTRKSRTRRFDGSSNSLVSSNTTSPARRGRSENIPQDGTTQNETKDSSALKYRRSGRDECSHSMQHKHLLGNETESFSTGRENNRRNGDDNSIDIVVWNTTPITRSMSQGMSFVSQQQRPKQSKAFRGNRTGVEEFSSSMLHLRHDTDDSFPLNGTRPRSEHQKFNWFSTDIEDRMNEKKRTSTSCNRNGRLQQAMLSTSSQPRKEGVQTDNLVQVELDREHDKTNQLTKPRSSSNSGLTRRSSFGGIGTSASKILSDHEEIMSSSMPPLHLIENAIKKSTTNEQNISHSAQQDRQIQREVFRRSRSRWEDLSSSMPQLNDQIKIFPLNISSRQRSQHQQDHLLSSSSRDPPSKDRAQSKSQEPVVLLDDVPKNQRPAIRRRRSYTTRATTNTSTSKTRSRSASAIPSRKRVSFDLSTDSPEWLAQKQCRYLQRFYRNIHYMTHSRSPKERISRELENEEIIDNLIDLQGETMKNRNQCSSNNNGDEAVLAGKIQDDTSVTHSECTTRQRGSRNCFSGRDV